MAAVADLEWSGQDASISEIEHELARLREASASPEAGGNMRTSVMTHCAWLPPEWLDVGKATLAGMEERHPSRVLLLVPQPDEPDGLDAELSLRCFLSGESHVCSEVIELHLRGNRTRSPASIVLPLVISDLPVFCRWRGEPWFGEEPWEQLLDVADRVIVDSSEWDDLRYGELAPAFERTAVSDIAWARLRDWRLALSDHWPAIRNQEICVRGPKAEATLLRGWLAARLERELAPIEQAEKLAVSLDGEQAKQLHLEPPSPSDLLSAELDRFTRERIYEEAAAAAG
jgi:hypothetical protein